LFFLRKLVLAVTLAGLMLLTAEYSRAEQVEFSSSMNPVGSGARATGMGGAFIAVADDATAASWNPAGLIHLEKPEVSIVYSYFNRGQSYNSATHPELTGTTHEIDLHDVNFASLAYPFNLLDRNMIVTLNYQRLYDMNKHINADYLHDWGNGDFVRDRIDFNQTGYLGAISPAIALQILPELYFGATVNIWDDIFGTCNWGFRERGSGTGMLSGAPYRENFIWTEKNTFSGLNANLGLLYTLNGTYSFGFVLKTPFTAAVNKVTSYTYEGVLTPPPPEKPQTSTSTQPSDKNLKMDMPLSYGFGLAYRHSDSLSFALDVYRTQWSDFAIIDDQGNKINPISGAPLEQGKPQDTTQVRVGAEYLFIGNKLVIPLRGGFFYDPQPGREKIDDFFGFSVGSGIAYNKVAFDLSYQYRWGNRVSSDISQAGISSDITQHTVMTSLIYHF
jgi:long-subunit fatty acid transport protein